MELVLGSRLTMTPSTSTDCYTVSSECIGDAAAFNATADAIGAGDRLNASQSILISGNLTGNSTVGGKGILDLHELRVLRQITLVFYLLAFAFGLVGNGLVIYVIGKHEKIRSRSVSNYYIWNLAFADLVYVLTIPFFCFATFANNWPFGWFCCKLATVFREVNKYAIVLTLVALSIDRFLATFHQFGKFRQIRVGIAVCVTIWLICLILSTPYWSYADVVATSRGRESCLFRWPNITGLSHKETRLVIVLCQLVLGLLVPFVVISTFSGLLLRRVRSRSETTATSTAKGVSRFRFLRRQKGSGSTSSGGSGRQCIVSASAGATPEVTVATRASRRNEANSSMTRVVMAIVTMFGVCQLPYYISEIFSLWVAERVKNRNAPNIIVMELIIYFNALAQILLFVSSCCNPIIYGVLNKNYRQLYGQAICCCCPSCQSRTSYMLTTSRAGGATVQRTNAANDQPPPEASDRLKKRRGTEFFAVASTDGAQPDVSRSGGIASTLTVSSRLLDETRSSAAATDGDVCRDGGQSRGLYLEVPGSNVSGNVASANEETVSQGSSSPEGRAGITVVVPVASTMS